MKANNTIKILEMVEFNLFSQFRQRYIKMCETVVNTYFNSEGRACTCMCIAKSLKSYCAIKSGAVHTMCVHVILHLHLSHKIRIRE